MSSQTDRSKPARLSGRGRNGAKAPKLNALPDSELFRWIRENLYVPVVCDVLDEMGHYKQAMHQRLRPLDEKNCIIVGRARTFRWMETDYVVEGNPYGKEIEAIDSLKPGDVAVHSTDAGLTNAPWGELMSTAAKCNGAAGCICDSLIRDCKKIVKIGFPVFYAGIRPVDSKGRGCVMAYDVPIRCGDVLVNAGDLIFADFDGVVVVPRKIEKEVLERAGEKVSKENSTRNGLLAGRSLQDVYDEFGVL